MKVTKDEIANVSKLDAFARYKYMLKRIADSEWVYVLKEEENFAIAIVEGEKIFSIWSAPEFALLCAIKEWSGYQVTSIDLDTFKNEIGALISKQGFLINAFSIPNKTGFVVDWEELWRDLNEELKNYE